MAGDKVFAKGTVAFAPHEKAPKWVLGTLVISPEVLFHWCNGEGAEWVSDYKGTKQIKLQITKLQDGKLSVQVDTYKKGDAKPEHKPKKEENWQHKDVSDDLPFAILALIGMGNLFSFLIF